MAKTTRITKIDRRGQRATIITYRGGGTKGQIEIPGGMRDVVRRRARDARLLEANGLPSVADSTRAGTAPPPQAN